MDQMPHATDESAIRIDRRRSTHPQATTIHDCYTLNEGVLNVTVLVLHCFTAVFPAGSLNDYQASAGSSRAFAQNAAVRPPSTLGGYARRSRRLVSRLTLKVRCAGHTATQRRIRFSSGRLMNGLAGHARGSHIQLAGSPIADACQKHQLFPTVRQFSFQRSTSEDCLRSDSKSHHEMHAHRGVFVEPVVAAVPEWCRTRQRVTQPNPPKMGSVASKAS